MLGRVLDDFKVINESNRSYCSELDRLRVSFIEQFDHDSQNSKILFELEVLQFE